MPQFFRFTVKTHSHNNSIAMAMLSYSVIILISVGFTAAGGVVREVQARGARTAKGPSLSAQRPARKKRQLRDPDVIYYPTPTETVDEMLRLAKIKKGDVLYDLGSGDGRIPIAAAQQYGIRAVGIEIDPKLVTEAQEKAQQEGVSDLVRFRNEDMFRIDVSEATVVTLYLSEKLNVLLRPKLLRELRPGSRILSHDFRMGDWKPEQTVRVPWGKLYRTVYLWTVPGAGRTRKHSLTGKRH
jgi:SAM-dependent methyltransferase